MLLSDGMGLVGDLTLWITSYSKSSALLAGRVCVYTRIIWSVVLGSLYCFLENDLLHIEFGYLDIREGYFVEMPNYLELSGLIF